MRLGSVSNGLVSPSLKRCKPSIASQARCWRALSGATQSKQKPLSILYCGSDEFSKHSLNAIAELQPDHVESIDVVCRPPKRTGRRLQYISYPPIYDLAQSLNLQTHTIDTFTGWSPPTPPSGAFDLVIAVSFGLLVPPRILSMAQFGGLNVHPSLLPDLYGPAPIEWALMNQDKHTGITLQTLHPSKFDQGKIIDQTPLPGILLPESDATSTSLAEWKDRLGRLGAEMLATNIKNRTFLTPHSPNNSAISSDPPRHAPKLTRETSHLQQEWTASHLLTREKVLGALWTTFPDTMFLTPTSSYGGTKILPATFLHRKGTGTASEGEPKVFLEGWEDVTTAVEETKSVPSQLRSWRLTSETGKTDWSIMGLGKEYRFLLTTSDGRYLSPSRIKVPGAGFKELNGVLQQCIHGTK